MIPRYLCFAFCLDPFASGSNAPKATSKGKLKTNLASRARSLAIGVQATWRSEAPDAQVRKGRESESLLVRGDG